jgi:two-component system, NtrC family, response regulator
MATVLIIDDEKTLRGLMARVIQLEGYQVLEASSIQEGFTVLRKESVQVVITDVKLPDGNGVDQTSKIKFEFPSVEIIVLTAFGTIEDGVRAIKNGAFDYLTKGDHQEKIIPLLSKASERAILQERISRLESKLHRKFGFASILGSSKQLKQSIDLARRVAATDTTVLLLGETGSGKEVFAQAIHYESNRKSKPFIALNCSAFPKDLLESELFGHAEGAFTGATKVKRGLLEEAQDGTLFLDEIGEMHLDLQAKFLRVVEAREFYRVGETKPRQINARLIAATNRQLEKEVEAGHFRQDLFYRLSVFTINIPSLRERKEDIEFLAQHFVNDFSPKISNRIIKMTGGFVKALEQHSWKGNIRELKNVIERCVILTDSNELTVALLPSDFNDDAHTTSLDLATAEKKHIQKVLNYSQGNKTLAAKTLNIGLTTLYQKIKDYNL